MDDPRLARIVAVADALDAITTNRRYPRGVPVRVACEDLKRCRNTPFEPEVEVVDALLSADVYAMTREVANARPVRDMLRQ